MSGLIFGVNATLKRLNEKGYTLSWTRKNQFEGCQAQWFLNNICTPDPEVIVSPLLREDTYALPGWVIQKLFETYINGRVYRSMKSVDESMKWFDRNLRILCEVVTRIPYEGQLAVWNPRYFFDRGDGRAILSEAFEKGLDPGMKDLQIHFIDSCVFERVNKDWESFYIKISDILRRVLEMWIRDGVNLDLMFCEQKVEAYLNIGVDQLHIEGFTDYIYNTYGEGCFENINSLKDGYTLLDGKYNLSRFVHEEQLQLYATLIYIMTGKMPEYMMFLEYKGCRYKAFQPDRGYVRRLRESCMRLTSVLAQIRSWLTSIKEYDCSIRDFDAVEAPVVFTPNATSCCFCGARDICPSFMESPDIRRETGNFIGKRVKERIMKEFETLDPSVVNIGSL